MLCFSYSDLALGGKLCKHHLHFCAYFSTVDRKQSDNDPRSHYVCELKEKKREIVLIWALNRQIYYNVKEIQRRRFSSVFSNMSEFICYLQKHLQVQM